MVGKGVKGLTDCSMRGQSQGATPSKAADETVGNYLQCFGLND